MEHQPWIKRSLLVAAVAASIGLTACGGGGDSAGTVNITPATATLSGTVADGYLVNATVCLDLNLSKTCDPGEPTATSTSGGSYSLDATQAQIDTSPIVAEIIAGTTVDEDDPSAPVAKAYTLSAPAGKGAFISPLTTMVQAQIETTGKTAEQIENEILASIGQDPTLVSLFDDYVSKKADSTNPVAVQDSYLKLHQIAQVTAATIANNIEVIEATINTGEVNLDLATTLDSLINIIVQSVITELTAIANEIDSATTFDANTIATTVDATVDTATIEDQVAVAEAASNAVAASNVESIFSTGISWLWAEFLPWENNMERSLISYDAATKKISEPIESYFSTATPGWSLLPNTDDKLVLQTNGTWLPITDSLDGSSATFDNISGTAIISSPWGNEVFSNVNSTDLTSLSVKQFVANKLPNLAKSIDSAATFTSGSNAYSLNITSLSDSYSIWIWGGCGGGINGNCNVVYNPSTSSPATSLADLLNPTAVVNSGDFPGSMPIKSYELSYVANVYYELVGDISDTSGAVVYYQNPTGTNTLLTVGNGTWDIRTVNGVNLLMVDHPDALISHFLPIAPDLDSAEENHFFAIQDFVVRKGDHWPANIIETTAESILTNQQAQDEITGAFLSATVINAIPSVELTCDTDSEWNPLIDKPLVSYSFADYEAVVTACGGAQSVDANALDLNTDGLNRYHRLSDGASIQFQLDNTGTYQKDSVSINFNWTIDPLTNYITVENSPTTFRNILAVVSVDSTVVPAVFTFKGYIEQIGRSDMVTNQGSDGEI